MACFSYSLELPSVSTASNGAEEMAINVCSLRFSKDSLTADVACVDKSAPAWKSVPLSDATPGRRGTVAHLRAMGGDPTCVPLDFNSSMLGIWEELWHSMPQNGRVSITVNSNATRSVVKPRGSDHDTHLRALLPVSFAQAKDWLLRQQKAQSEALQTGAVNQDAREVIADLNRSLAEQPASTAALLEQPVRPGLSSGSPTGDVTRS